MEIEKRLPELQPEEIVKSLGGSNGRSQVLTNCKRRMQDIQSTSVVPQEPANPGRKTRQFKPLNASSVQIRSKIVRGESG